MTNDQRMVDVRLLERCRKMIRGDCQFGDELTAIISGPGVEPVAWATVADWGPEKYLVTANPNVRDAWKYDKREVLPLTFAAPSAPVQPETELPWRCFHCDETFTDAVEAALHFGPRIYSDPACHVDAKYLRDLERQLEGYREEDTDLHRQMHAMASRHQTELRREEEKGYARGLRDSMAVALAPVQAVPDWQPIETAPRDGTTIIAYRPTDPPHIEGMHWCNYDDGADGAWHWSYDGDSPIETQPTHWMPLPQPPKGIGE